MDYEARTVNLKMLSIGTKLGRYEIRSKIGAGGMGGLTGGRYATATLHTL
ncbi:MAG: hypothetical protein ABI923_10495 [bacterium]